MQFVATLEHDPADCWARPEKEGMAEEWIANMEDHAAAHDVGLRGAYATPNEHTFYFVLEADDLEAVSAFLGPPFLQDHDGHVAPVITMSEAVETLLAEEH